MKYFIVGILALAASACSGGGSSPPTVPSAAEVSSSLKILASNVIIGTAQAADGVDTTTKVLASNVTLDTKGLSIASTNVQDAFGETEPDPASALIGTWKGVIVGNTTSYNTTMTFNVDNTFTCTTDSPNDGAPLGFADYGPCSVASTSKSWSLLGKRVLKLSYSYDVVGNPPTPMSVGRIYLVLHLGATHVEFYSSYGNNVAILSKQ